MESRMVCIDELHVCVVFRRSKSLVVLLCLTETDIFIVVFQLSTLAGDQ
jgi:hypothetical protein